MLDAKLKLEAKLTTIKQEREHLKALMELVEAKELTTRTIKSLDDLAGVGDDDVQRLGDQIRARLDREEARMEMATTDRKSTRLNSSHVRISYAVFCLKKKKKKNRTS